MQISGGGGGNSLDSSIKKTILPKQFLEINGIPIIILTLNNILKSKLFDFIYIVIHKDWIDYLNELLILNNIPMHNITILKGGNERIDSIENALDCIAQHNPNNEDLVVFTDAVRPFIDTEILTNALNWTNTYGASVAIIPAKDTMIISKDNFAIDMPNRANIFHGQAPDSFKFSIIYNALKSLTLQERQYITGTAQIAQLRNIKIATFKGSENNIKITTKLDLFLAKAIFKELYE